MMAMLFAQRVILGKTEFRAVPESLKPQVYVLLVESGVEFLAGEYLPALTQRVISGLTQFSTLPESLKPQIYALLLELGKEALVGSYVPPVQP
jgi:hypothetical protein